MISEIIHGYGPLFCRRAAAAIDDLPSVSVATHTTLCTHNPLGVKGCGEVGAIGSPPAIINAVVDALSDYGVTHVEMPATPAKLWQIINSGRRAAAE